MITERRSQPREYDPHVLTKATFHLDGLSTDTKPKPKYDNVEIRNGSDFLELDTQNISFYDEDAQDWV